MGKMQKDDEPGDATPPRAFKAYTIESQPPQPIFRAITKKVRKESQPEKKELLPGHHADPADCAPLPEFPPSILEQFTQAISLLANTVFSFKKNVGRKPTTDEVTQMLGVPPRVADALIELSYAWNLTSHPELRDPQQMRENAKTAGDAKRIFDGMKATLDEVQKPTADALELFLHQLPEIRFESLEERQFFESAMDGLLTRLGKRLALYDVEKGCPQASSTPSRLRLNSTGKGYFQLDGQLDRKRNRDAIGPELPPLTLVPLPQDNRARNLNTQQKPKE